MNGLLLLDACALVALMEKEPGAEVVRSLFESAKNRKALLKMNRLNLLEVYYYNILNNPINAH